MSALLALVTACAETPRSVAKKVSAPKQPARWASYGFDFANSQVNPAEHVLGVKNVAKLRERWRLHMPDGATSTPAIYDGIAYFGGWNGDFYAVDADSGAIRWQRRVTPIQANSTAFVTDDRVFVTAGASLLALERTDGAIVFETLLDPHPAAMVWSSPKLIDGMLILGVASFEIGISDQPTFIGSVVAIDAESGQEVWRVATSGAGDGPCHGGPGAAVWSSAAIDQERGLAFIGTGQGYAEPASTCSDSLLALYYEREHHGDRLAWFAQYTKDDIFGLVNALDGPDADVGAAPNLFEAGGRALVGAGDKGGSYRAFDRDTGELVWRTDLAIGPFPSFGGVTTTAAYARDTIYVASNHFETSNFILTGVRDPLDVAYLYALDSASGQERWQVELPSPMAGSFAIANGVLYHSIIDRTLYARELTTGDVLWSSELPNDPGSGPSVVDGRVFVSAGMALTAVVPTELGGYVMSFGLDGGKSMLREANVDVLEPLSEPECRTALESSELGDACSACLCACDASAAGHCGPCTTLAACTVASCASAAAGDDMRACLAMSCNAKLLPSYVLDRAVDLGPCTLSCAASCGF